jgi:CYTH domain-containing protein
MTMDRKDLRIERERRFLLRSRPADLQVVGTRHIIDAYIDGTRLRLRQMRAEGGETKLKLTQKIPEHGEGAQQGWITTIYLTPAEYALLSQLPAKKLKKTRLSVPPFGIDIFEGALEGLVMAEAEFDSAHDAAVLTIPPWAVHEVTADPRSAGGELVRTSSEELRRWLAQHGLEIGRNRD